MSCRERSLSSVPSGLATIGGDLIHSSAALDCEIFSNGGYTLRETEEAKKTLVRAYYCE